MDLKLLFEMQKILRDHIGYNEPDRFNKLILALLVEIGECANEWRGFKYWSQNQLPNTYAPCEKCSGLGWYYYNPPINEKTICECFDNPKNPLIEEYVDGLHFVLELGLELNIDKETQFGIYIGPSVTDQFNFVFQDVSELCKSVYEDHSQNDIMECFDELIRGYIGLGEMLGFTLDQIEQAYFEKNKINHERLDNGY